MAANDLIGVGLFTPAEASRLIDVPAGKITRWLKGHTVQGRRYERLWEPQIDVGDGRVYLGFRDLMEMRAAHAFISAGVSAVAIRRTIGTAAELLGEPRPLSTKRFRTDGRTIFLEVLEDNGHSILFELFSRQYAFRQILERSLRDIDYTDMVPSRWWPLGRLGGILIDPERSFGQPIDSKSGVPTAALASAATAEGSIERAAKVWSVNVSSVRRALEFEKGLDAGSHKRAA